jgi:hypothetical protein
MAETADFLKAVHLRGPFLETSDEEHFSKQLDLEAYVTPGDAACRAVLGYRGCIRARTFRACH